MYADDTEMNGFCRPSATTALAANITNCVEAATSWMLSNPDKTEFDCPTTTSDTNIDTADRQLLYHSGQVLKPARDVFYFGNHILTSSANIFSSVVLAVAVPLRPR